jgi:prepilin-type N-terminal cleavage/methylation domain-containing protein/prepilin-type processing-associated H-X9-DG protein
MEGAAEMGRRTSDDRGFTLIELLVVIAIIAILAAILFPMFLKTKEIARINTCLCNLKQIGNGIQMYIDDHQGRFPMMLSWGRSDSSASAAGYKLQAEVLPKYVKSYPIRAEKPADPNKWYESAGVLRCPDDFGYPREVGDMAGCKSRPYSVWQQCGSSYDYCCEDQSNWQNTAPPEMIYGKNTVKYSGLSPSLRGADGQWHSVGAPISAVRFPTRKGMLADMWNWHLSESNSAGYDAHRNTLYVDGHAARTWWKDWGRSRALWLSPWFSADQKYE